MGRSDSSAVFRFGDFEADVRAGELRKNGIKIPLQEQPFQLLTVLLERPGELIRRDELRRRLWPQDTFVAFDHALNTAVKKIRIALDDHAAAPRYIETIPKRGYRFMAPVSVEGSPEERVLNESFPPRAQRWYAGIPARTVFALIVLVSVVLAGVRWKTARALAEKQVVLAVLPFEDWRDGAGHSLLSDGITQELITQSARAAPAWLTIVPRASCLTYRHTTKTVAEVAHELHADYLVEGNLRGDERRIRVTVELIRVSDEARVWGDDFDRDTGDTLQLEGEVAAAITGKVRSALFPSSTPRQ